MKAKQVNAFAAENSIERRSIRAATESMVVDPFATPEGSGQFEVHSQSGNTYLVDLREGSCSCPDFGKREDQLRQNGGCKHSRRVRFALGLDPIPVALRDDLDPALEASMVKFGAFEDDEDDEHDEHEEELIVDGGSEHLHGNEHADGCTDPVCEGLDAPGRPELSFECWHVWSAESHGWSDKRGRDTTLSEDDATDLAVEQIVATIGLRIGLLKQPDTAVAVVLTLPNTSRHQHGTQAG